MRDLWSGLSLHRVQKNEFRCLAYSLCIQKNNSELTIAMVSTKICIDCKQEKPIVEFYKQNDHQFGVMSYCKNCFNFRCVQRWKNRKIKALEYKGFACERCGLHLKDAHFAVFEFHHLNPKQKEFDWSKLRLKSWKKITDELDKCILVCANCHRIIHAESEGFPDQPKSQ